MILVVRHTFGRHHNFNPHLHVLASARRPTHVDGEFDLPFRIAKLDVFRAPSVRRGS